MTRRALFALATVFGLRKQVPSVTPVARVDVFAATVAHAFEEQFTVITPSGGPFAGLQFPVMKHYGGAYRRLATQPRDSGATHS